MALSKTGIKNYLEQKTDNWDWLKKTSPKTLREELEYHSDGLYTPKTDPYHCQLVSTLLGVINRNFLFLLDMGAGKSKIATDLIRTQRTEIKKTLILVPNLVAIASFTDQVRTHSDMTCEPLIGTRKDRINTLFSTNSDVYVINYAGVVSLCSTKGKRGKKVVDPREVASLANRFNCFILDEIHVCKNANTLTFKVLKALTRDAKFRYGLTGTPMNKNPIDLWSQFYLIDRGDTLGETLGIYREGYFKKKKNYFGGYEYVVAEKSKKLINERIKHRSIRYTEDELDDLPDKVYTDVHVELSPLAEQMYNKTNTLFIESLGKEYSEVKNIFVKMRQITAGFMKLKAKDEDVYINRFPDNPKIDAMLELINETPDGSKVVVFNEYTDTGDIICDALKDAKIKHYRLYGKTKNKTTVVKKFTTDKKAKVFVVNTQSGSTSLNLQCANYVIFYESTVSSLNRKQAEKRCHRSGQSKRVYFYDLIARNTIDERVLEILKDGKEAFKSIIEGLRKENS